MTFASDRSFKFGIERPPCIVCRIIESLFNFSAFELLKNWKINWLNFCKLLLSIGYNLRIYLSWLTRNICMTVTFLNIFKRACVHNFTVVSIFFETVFKTSFNCSLSKIKTKKFNSIVLKFQWQTFNKPCGKNLCLFLICFGARNFTKFIMFLF